MVRSVEGKQKKIVPKTVSLNQSKSLFINDDEQLQKLKRLLRMIEQQKNEMIEEDYKRIKRVERQKEYGEEVRQR